MVAVAEAVQSNSLANLEAVLNTHHHHLHQDPVVKQHLDHLLDSILERNLLHLLKPYSRVQIDHLAHKINMDRDKVETFLKG